MEVAVADAPTDGAGIPPVIGIWVYRNCSASSVVVEAVACAGAPDSSDGMKPDAVQTAETVPWTEHLTVAVLPWMVSLAAAIMGCLETLHSSNGQSIFYARSAVFDIGEWPWDAAVFRICTSRALNLICGRDAFLFNPTIKKERRSWKYQTRTMLTMDPTKGWGSAFTINIEADV